MQSTLSQKRALEIQLKNQIAQIEAREPTLANKFMQEYPFYIYREGASGWRETTIIAYYQSLGDKVLNLGNSRGWATYPTGRTLCPRTFINSAGAEVTTIPNINPSGYVGAGNSFCGHFVYNAQMPFMKESILKLSIGEIVKTQEDYIDSQNARALHYPRELFADLENIAFTYEEYINNFNLQKNNELTPLKEQLLNTENEILTLTQGLSNSLAQSRQELENLNNQLAEIQRQIQEQEARLPQLENEINSARTELQNAEANKALKQNELNAVQERFNQVSTLLQEAEAKNAEALALENQKQELENQIRDLENRLNQISPIDLQDLQNQKAELQNQKQELENRINASLQNNTQSQELNNQITQLREDINALNNQLQNPNDLQDLQNQKQELENSNLSNLNNQNEILENSNDNQNDALNSEVAENQNLNNDLSESKENNAEVADLENSESNDFINENQNDLENEILENENTLTIKTELKIPLELQSFLITYPEFKEAVTTEEEIFSFMCIFEKVACLYPEFKDFENCKNRYPFFMLVAHYAVMEGLGKGVGLLPQKGLIASSSVGDVSVSYQSAPYSTKGDELTYFLSLTEYGTEYLAWLARQAGLSIAN